ncbi:hypothetical protein Y032_0215g2362 [Ancylostoma ceylanicum]|nr:hypothetical protein Y032_0215g2362 [Ancylostoma ceylanicum]
MWFGYSAIQLKHPWIREFARFCARHHNPVDFRLITIYDLLYNNFPIAIDFPRNRYPSKSMSHTRWRPKMPYSTSKIGTSVRLTNKNRRKYPVSLLKVVTELREMRHGAVQMDAQYLYMHRILLVVAENLKIITPAETEKFTQDYDNFLKSRGFL